MIQQNIIPAPVLCCRLEKNSQYQEKNSIGKFNPVCVKFMTPDR